MTRKARKGIFIVLVGLAGAVLGTGAAAGAAGQAGPFAEAQHIVPTDETGGALPNFGDSTAISADGSTALIAAVDDGNTGSVWVYVRGGGVWSEQAKIVNSDSAGLGGSLALSSDGNTAIMRGGGADNPGGAEFVYTRTGSAWSEQQKIIPPAGQGFGLGAAVSADGNVAVFGSNATAPPAAFIYTRSGSTWSLQQQLVLPGAGWCCWGVALSADGSTAAIDGGGPFPASQPTVWMFADSGGTWAPQQAITGPPDEIGASSLGTSIQSVSLSGDGNTVLIGGYGDNNYIGAAWVFTRDDGEWSEQAKLVPSDVTGSMGYFGTSVSLSGNGGTALVGGDADQFFSPGAAWIYQRSGATWTEEQKLVPDDAPGGYADFGSTVALSADSSTALIGAQAGNGQAWIYTQPLGPPTPTGTTSTQTTTPTTTAPATTITTTTPTTTASTTTLTTTSPPVMLPPAACSLKVLGERAKPAVRRGRKPPKKLWAALLLSADCDQAVVGALAATVTETEPPTRGRPHHERRTRRIVLPVRHVSLLASIQSPLTVALPEAVLRDIETGARASVALKLNVSNASGVSHATAAVRHLHL